MKKKAECNQLLDYGYACAGMAGFSEYCPDGRSGNGFPGF